MKQKTLKKEIFHMADIKETVTLSSEISETIIGAQTKFKGNVQTDKPIRIDGVFEGDIESNDLVLVSETGSVKGNIKCSEFQLIGKAEGTAECRTLMQFAATGRFDGDIVTASLITVPGSIFNGNCRMTTE